jgi:hypothetical protein
MLPFLVANALRAAKHATLGARVGKRVGFRDRSSLYPNIYTISMFNMRIARMADLSEMQIGGIFR